MARLAAGVLSVAGLLALGTYLAVGDRGEVETLRNPVVWAGGRVRVEVFNGGGVSGMARDATGVLRDAGFDVVTFGNADRFDPARPSEVVDRVGRPDAASAVAAALGIDSVRSEPDPNLFVDVTVVVGRSWSAPPAGERPLDGAGEGPWWDPRDWFGT